MLIFVISFGFQDLRARDLEQMFPIVDPKAKPTARPKIFVSLLWKQLNHLGQASYTFEHQPSK